MSRRALICLALTVGCTASFAGVTVVVAPRPVIVPRIAPPVRVAPPAGPKAAPAAAPAAVPKNGTAQEAVPGATPAAQTPVVVPIVVPHPAAATRNQECADRSKRRNAPSGTASDCKPAVPR